ncbi:hypothetical protein TIFTF001_022687 [Ficus carica]|uniref:RING-type E3 ubiquitin transferase n=1 Tax=Ficus carica TaxID=3494 RepID=A0AA88AEX8_FICCA|nr:hypothetical protein TIFTF001_022687 [Ficus carica]
MLDDIHPDGERRWSSEKGIVVAVAVDKAKASQHALKWAVDHLLYKDKNKTLISLVHVRHTLPPIAYSHPIPRNNSLVEREPYDDEMEMLRPYGGFCARRQIQFEVVVLEDDDVAQALVDYSIRHRVENLILGVSSRNDLSRLFKQHSRTARTVMKWIPNFCNVYVISKLGKLNGVRNACHPVPIIPSVHDHHQTHHDILAVSRGRRPASDVGLCTDHTISESEIESCTFASPESTRPSTDGMFLSFFETLESRLARVFPPNFSSVDSLDSIQTQGNTSWFLLCQNVTILDPQTRFCAREYEEHQIKAEPKNGHVPCSLQRSFCGSKPRGPTWTCGKVLFGTAGVGCVARLCWLNARLNAGFRKGAYTGFGVPELA